MDIKILTDNCIARQNQILSDEATIQSEYAALIARQKAVDEQVHQEIKNADAHIKALKMHKKALNQTLPVSWWKFWR